MLSAVACGSSLHQPCRLPLSSRRCAKGLPALRAQEQTAGDAALEQDPVRKYGLLAFWASFILYATFLAPNVNPEASTALLPELFKLPGENTVNPVFLAIFGMLGVWPAVMAALVIPLQPKAQSLKAWPFVTASFGLGAFGLTPYLALTSYDQSAEVDSDSAVASFVGSRAFGIFQLLSTVLAYMYAGGFFQPNDINGGSDFPVDVIFAYFLKLFWADFNSIKLVNIPSCDFVALWMLSSKPLYEDMKRRGWMKGSASDWGLYLSFMLTPLVGACTWLAVRPEITQSNLGSPAAEEMADV